MSKDHTIRRQALERIARGGYVASAMVQYAAQDALALVRAQDRRIMRLQVFGAVLLGAVVGLAAGKLAIKLVCKTLDNQALLCYNICRIKTNASPTRAGSQK
jgi:hypothetical protein